MLGTRGLSRVHLGQLRTWKQEEVSKQTFEGLSYKKRESEIYLSYMMCFFSQKLFKAVISRFTASYGTCAPCRGKQEPHRV